MAIKVSLRKKPILGNKESLYLDFYPKIIHSKTGKSTRREFLNLFLVSEIEYSVQWYEDENKKRQRRIIPVLKNNDKQKIRKLTVLEKQHNKNTWDIAEQIRQRRENELNKPEIYSDFEREKIQAKEAGKGSFIEYFKSLADQRYGSDKKNWYIVYNYLNDFTNGKLSFNDLNEKLCEEFRSYILDLKSYDSDNSIKQNSAAAYFTKFRTSLKQAYKDKKIPVNLNSGVSTIKIVETQRNFLSLEELNRLAKAECPWPMLKKAFLFSALTGMRYSDVVGLQWKSIEIIDNKPAIRFTQKKTHGVETHWISYDTLDLLGNAGKPDDYIFPGFHLNSTNARYMDRWLGNAQISKHITFHSARHTYATLQLSKDTNPYVIQRLLGHKSFKSTEIYVKVIDKLKQDAADRIKLDL